jgi:SAM-dependent methyltransferase
MDPLPTQEQFASYIGAVTHADPDHEEFFRTKKTGSYELALSLAGRAVTPDLSRKLACDFGCAQGYGLKLIQAAGYEVVGVEIDPRAVEYCQGQGLRVYEGDGLRALPPGTEVELLFCLDVLCYVDRPFALLQSAWHVVKPGGAMVIRTNIWGATAHVASLLGRLSGRSRRLASLLLCDGLNTYSPRGLRGILGGLGWRRRVEEVDPSHSTLLGRSTGLKRAALKAFGPLLRFASGDRLHILPSTTSVWTKPS